MYPNYPLEIGKKYDQISMIFNDKETNTDNSRKSSSMGGDAVLFCGAWSFANSNKLTAKVLDKEN
jgi:hypothetical protein